jgi:hypothetical protein
MLASDKRASLFWRWIHADDDEKKFDKIGAWMRLTVLPNSASPIFNKTFEESTKPLQR